MVRELPGPVSAGEYNVYTGKPAGLEPGDDAGRMVARGGTGQSGFEPIAARLGLEPPRFCAQCGRRMVVQVRPDGWWAECSRHGLVDSADLEPQG